uniref:Uncharacterized protein n=1 Tax=Anguilla anguilla TaxID=7936 RepID=A0A0E9QC42_ANGAN
MWRESMSSLCVDTRIQEACGWSYRTSL